MADTLDTTAAPRRLLVDGRDPTPDEAITTDDGGTLVSIGLDPAGSGSTLVTGVADANGTVVITVAPGAADTGRSAGSDTVTVITPTPLVVTLG